MSKKVAIIGAGPAGLTAAYLLAKGGQQVTVFEKDFAKANGDKHVVVCGNGTD